MYKTKHFLGKPKVIGNLITGFTLLELIVVMAVIGGLAGIIIMNFPAGLERARDTHRRSDLKQFQTALETYANKKAGVYPAVAVDTEPKDLCGGANPLYGYTSCPIDPKDGVPNKCSGVTCGYHYLTNASGSEYSLWAALERPADNNKFWFIVCSTGITYEGATQPGAGNLCP